MLRPQLPVVIPRPQILAFLLWTLSAAAAGASVTLRPVQPITKDCRVHVLSEEGIESRHPCGESLSFPDRARTLWIEQSDMISGQVDIPHADTALVLVPAGEVSLAHQNPAKQVRVIHAGSTRFARDLVIGTSEQRIRMPAGAAVALYLDDSGEVIGTGRATLTKKPVVLVPEAPASGADVVGLFTVVTPVENGSNRFVIGPDHLAALVIDRGNEIIALWRSLPSGPAEFTLRSRALQLAAVPLRLRERKVTTVRADLRPLPRLTVTVQVPEESRAEWLALEPTITLRRAADRKPVQQEPATSSQEFPLLAVDVYDVVLHSKPWAFARRADLSSGDDASVSFELNPFTINGQVTIGNEPASASIKFGRGGMDHETVRNDANGYYSVTLWSGGLYLIETTLDEAVSQPPFSKLIRLSSSRQLDIHVPRTNVVVSVTDAVTNKPVPNANVGVLNHWTDPQSGKAGASHSVTTDSSGHARLAPMNPGTAEIGATADGYFNSDPTTIAVDENGAERIVEIQLRSANAGSALRVVLPNGAPAANAEILVVGDRAGLNTLWSGRTDERGQVRIPTALEQSLVLVRHPSAAGLARQFQNLPNQEYRLPPSSPQALIVNVERDGAPATYGGITVWFDDLPLSWTALEFLVRGPAHISPKGSWTGRTLPAGPVRILASSGSVDAAIAAGAYDALATTIPEPRPAQVILRAVD